MTSNLAADHAFDPGSCQPYPPRVLVVAELGVNHDGLVDRAERLIDQARDADADAVKLQYFRPQRLLSHEARLAGYQTADSASDLLEGLTLGLDQIAGLSEHAHAAGLLCIVTPFSLDDVAELATLDGPARIDAIKIASPDAVNTPLIDAALKLQRPVIVSTGTCDLDELGPAADRLRTHAQRGTIASPSPRLARPAGRPDLPPASLLQCVSAYPTLEEDAALAAIAVLASAFDLPVGYSDHTTAVDTGGLAVAAGARILEKHLTHNTKAPGPDHAASLSPADFTAYVSLARRAARMLGPAIKRCLPQERDVRDVSRQSLAAARDLPPGRVLDATDVAIRRPGTGIPPAELQRVLGRSLRRPVAAGGLLHEADLNPD